MKNNILKPLKYQKQFPNKHENIEQKSLLKKEQQE